MEGGHDKIPVNQEGETRKTPYTAERRNVEFGERLITNIQGIELGTTK